MQEEKRNKVYNLYECGITDRSEIAKRTNIPYSTVCQIIARKNEGKPVEHMAGAGRPTKLNSSADLTQAPPDLSIIENVWGLMKNRIENLDPRSVPLWNQEIQNFWDDVDQGFNRKLYRKHSK